MYVPNENFRINDPDVKYSQLIKPNTVNPEYLRYELHRVWVLEGTLKEGVRHIYSKRRLYIDEDSWLALMADNYDSRGQLWRVPLKIGRAHVELQSLMRISSAVFCLKKNKPEQ